MNLIFFRVYKSKFCFVDVYFELICFC